MPRNSGGTQSIEVEKSPVLDGNAVRDLIHTGIESTTEVVHYDRLSAEPPAAPAPPSIQQVPEGKVLLLNFKFENETFFLPSPDPRDGELRFDSQARLEFVNGGLVCSRSQADHIISRAPHVFEEPQDLELPIHEVPTATQPFKTRNPSAAVAFATKQAANA